MSYALVVTGIIQSESGVLPSSARRLDNQAWVMGLADAPVSTQQLTGWFAVVTVAKPPDTATDTYNRTLTIVSGKPQETWIKRAKTQAELTADTEAANKSAIQTNLEADLAIMQATIDATNATINANPATYIKDIARMNKRLGREALKKYDGVD